MHLPGHHRLTTLPLLTLLAVSCEQPAVELIEQGTVGQRRAAIVNGVESDGYRAVGALVSGNGASACTATLISGQTVLTAAHCVHQRWPIEFYVNDLSGPRYLAESVSIHPRYGGGNLADLAVVRLSRPVTGVQPMDLSTEPPRLGETVTLLGYGKTGEGVGSFGQRRVTTSRVAQILDELLIISGGAGNVCDGDSGGPTLAERDGREVLVGVHSTKGAVCGEAGNDMRVDAFRDWILRETETGGAIDIASDRSPPSARILTPANHARVESTFTVAVAASDDTRVVNVVLRLDGEVAAASRQAPYEFKLHGLAPGRHTIEVTAHDAAARTTSRSIEVTVVVAGQSDLAFGRSCASDDQCQSRICTGDSISRFCSRGCSAETPCREGFACLDGLCQLNPEQAAFGESCDAASRCAGDGLCARQEASGSQFCTRTCELDGELDGDTCPAGSLCTPTNDGQLAVCVPEATLSASPDQPGAGCAIGASASGDAAPVLVLSLLSLIVLGRLRRR